MIAIKKGGVDTPKPDREQIISSHIVPRCVAAIYARAIPPQVLSTKDIKPNLTVTARCFGTTLKTGQ